MNRTRRTRGSDRLSSEIRALRERLAEKEEVLRAIRQGEVDAVVIAGQSGTRVFMVEGADSTFRAMVEAMNDGAALVAQDAALIYCNRRFAAMLKAPLEEVMGAQVDRFVDPSNTAQFRTLLERGRSQNCAAEINLRCCDRSQLPVQLAASPVRVHDESGVCLVATDLVQQKRLQEELRNLSLKDELTGLYNRRGFVTLLEQHLKVACRLKSDIVLYYADLDGLKDINDRLGHAEGDQALIDAAEALKQTFRGSDVVARLGGDEFAVAAMWSNGMDPAMPVARLQRKLDDLNRRCQRPYVLSISIGMVRHDTRVSRPIPDLLATVDLEMYRSKRHNHALRAGVVGESPVARQRVS